MRAGRLAVHCGALGPRPSRPASRKASAWLKRPASALPLAGGSRKIEKPERILVEGVLQLFRNLLQMLPPVLTLSIPAKKSDGGTLFLIGLLARRQITSNFRLLPSQIIDIFVSFLLA